MRVLNEGLGLCKVEGRLALTLSTAAAQLGAAPEAFRTIFSAVHSVNRQAKSDDRAALVLPEMGQGYGMAVLGRSIEIFGSEAILAQVLAEPRIGALASRGLIAGRARVSPILFQAGGQGCYLSRTQAGSPITDASIARQARRDERRRDHIAATVGAARGRPALASPAPRKDLFLRLDGGHVLHMVRGTGAWDGQPVEVSTYGLSLAGTRAILPATPVALRLLDAVA